MESLWKQGMNSFSPGCFMKLIAPQHPSDLFTPVKYCWKHTRDLVLRKDGRWESNVCEEHVHFCSVCFITKSSNKLKLSWRIHQAWAIHSSSTPPFVTLRNTHLTDSELTFSRFRHIWFQYSGRNYQYSNSESVPVREEIDQSKCWEYV